MKKLMATIAFLTLLAFNIFADGNMGVGSRSCPPNTTCLVSNEPVDKPTVGILNWFELLLAKLAR